MSSDVMEPISAEDVAKASIVAKHHRMVENGEFRYRLLKEDEGTAYIRTEASEAGGWQNSHHHNSCTETYIVQSGWMAAAEMRDGQVALMRFGPGQIYSTEPGIVHNVYLPAHAVIHTVKHGPAAKGDWHGNTHVALELNVLTKQISEAQILSRAASSSERESVGPNARPGHSDSYRHFDNLIWQVPVWASAVFAIAAASLPDNSMLFENLRSDAEGARAFDWVAAFWTTLYSVVWLALSVFAIALYRFRRRQSVEAQSWVPFIKSASFWSMVLIALESALFLAIALVTAGAEKGLAVSVALTFALVVIAGSEIRMRRSPPLVAQRHS
jgi:mannose-6-phosphate isomerase-like protein (cupin superfamily)